MIGGDTLPLMQWFVCCVWRGKWEAHVFACKTIILGEWTQNIETVENEDLFLFFFGTLYFFTGNIKCNVLLLVYIG